MISRIVKNQLLQIDTKQSLENAFLMSFISPDIDKPYHFLWNSESSYKNWHSSKFYFLEKRILIFNKKDNNVREDIYLETNNFKSTIIEKSHKYCALIGKAYEETISFKLEFIKVITKLDGVQEIEVLTSPIQSTRQEMKIPIYVCYNGALPNGEIVTPDPHNVGGYFLPNKAIKKYITFKLDKTYTYPKYKNTRAHHHHISFNSIPLRFIKNSPIPQFLTIDLDLTYGKYKFIIDSKKSFIPADVPILIAFLSNLSLKYIKSIIYVKFDDIIIKLIIDIIFENSIKLLTEFNANSERKSIELYINKIILEAYARDKKFLQKQTEQEYCNFVLNNFLPHMNKMKRIDKAFYLINIVEHLLVASFQNNIYPDKEHLSTRRIAPLGSIYESISTSAIDICINDIKIQIEKEKLSSSNIEHIIKKLKPANKFQNAYNNFFNMQDKKHSTSVKPTTGSNYHQDITMPNMSVWESQVKLTKNLDARDPDISTFTVFGPVDTPDHSDNVALHRRITIGTKVSYMDIDTHRQIFEELERYIKINVPENKYDQFGVSIIIVDESEYYITSISNNYILEFVAKLKIDKVTNKFITNMIDIGLIPIYTKDYVKNILLPTNKFRQLRINIGNRIPYNPYFIVTDGVLLIQEKEYIDSDFKSFTRLIKKYQIIEFLGPEQRTYSNVCESVDIFNSLHIENKKMYNYVMFPAYINLSVLECMLYDIGRMPGVRGIFGAAQQKQIIMGPSADVLNKFESCKFLSFPYQQPCITNMIMQMSKIDSNGIGAHINVAFMSKNINVDDGLIINRDAVTNGALSMISLNIIKGEISSTQINVANPFKTNNSYEKLNALGVPEIGTVLVTGDALYKNVSPMFKEDRKYSFDNSEAYTSITPGRVERMFRIGTDTIQIKYILSSIHSIAKGDKLTTRAAQKGTAAKIAEPHELPYTINGQRPSIIMNSIGLLSRKTVNMYIETILTNMFGYTSWNGFIDYPPFSNISLEDLIKYVTKQIKDVFPNKTDKEIEDLVMCKQQMFDPYTHLPYKEDTYFAPVLFCRLSQIASEKISVRDRGKLNKLDQPPAGKKKGGAGRTGEMEFDILSTHGASSIIYELSQDVQEAQLYSMVCSRCGNFATIEKTIDYKRFKCLNCEELGFSPIINKIKLTKAVKTMMQILNFRGANIILEETNEQLIYPIEK